MTITVYELGGLEDFRYCPFCWRTLMAVKHKGIESFDRVPVFYRDRSPIDFTGQGKVPVLVDGDRWVNDSWDIADYLEDTYADRPALFGGDVGRGGAQFISAWTNQLRRPGLTEVILWDAFEHLDPADRDWWREDREKRFGRLEDYKDGREEKAVAWRQRLDPLRATLAKQPFLGGELPGYADYIMFGEFQWARCISQVQLIEADDPIYEWRETILDLFDGFARAAPTALG